jgi:hypothetical protein
MHDYALAHLSDTVLLRDLAALVARDRLTTAALLAHIAEVDARRLYLPAGYASMHAYCVEWLGLSEDAAYKRIQAARAARQFPALFSAVAEGRLHLAAVCLLAPHLTAENESELMEGATHRRKSEIEEMLARRFGPGEVGAMRETWGMVRALGIPAQPMAPQGVGTNDRLAPGQVEGPGAEPASPSPERYLLQLTIAKSTQEKLRYAQALLSHAVPTGNVAQVLDRALDALIGQLERRKFGAITRRPRPQRSSARASARGRYVPVHIRRAVWERDQGQCTFVSASGTRCKARRLLEFDHVDPVARGGQATVGGMRLRCRAHNQYEAERAFGAGFMSRKRQEARLAAAQARARAAAQRQSRDVLAGLRGLGCRADEARRAALFSGTLHGATLEERMRAALKFLSRRSIPQRKTDPSAEGHSGEWAPADGLHARSRKQASTRSPNGTD